MLTNYRSLFLLAAVFAIFAAYPSNAQTVTGSISGGAMTRGSSARGAIVLSIPSGLHVNSNRPSSQYAIPTTVRVSAVGARVSGVTYPRGKDRKFEFSENTISVYEGTVRFPFSVTLPAAFKGNIVRIRATVRYQACTNEVCYPPRSKEITFTARVR